MRKYLLQIAKERLKALGVGNVNKKLARKNKDGVPLWRAVLTGEFAKDGRDALKKARKIRRLAHE